jgi:hypothetical protein
MAASDEARAKTSRSENFMGGKVVSGAAPRALIIPPLAGCG